MYIWSVEADQGWPCALPCRLRGTRRPMTPTVRLQIRYGSESPRTTALFDPFLQSYGFSRPGNAPATNEIAPGYSTVGKSGSLRTLGSVPCRSMEAAHARRVERLISIAPTEDLEDCSSIAHEPLHWLRGIQVARQARCRGRAALQLWTAPTQCGPLIGGAFATAGPWRFASWSFALQGLGLAAALHLLPALAEPR